MGLSAAFGGISGALGTFISAQGAGWPTGYFIVLAASCLFLVSLVIGKEKGLLIEWLEYRSLQRESEPKGGKA